MFHGFSVLKTVYVSGCQTIECKCIYFTSWLVKKIRNFKFNIFYLKQAKTTDGRTDYGKEILLTLSAKLYSRTNSK
jgi:hypothetical protein